MAKCASCCKFISTKGGVVCYKCTNRFHLTCVGLPESGKSNNNWSCQGCNNNTNAFPSKDIGDGSSDSTPNSIHDSSRTTDGSTRSIQERPSSQVDVSYEMKLLRTELREMREDLKTELREIRLEMADLRQSVATYKKKVDSLEARVDHLAKQQAAIPPSEQLEQKILKLQTELNEREQELLLSDMEITNLPECAGENVIHTVELVAKKLGINLEERDIVFAERVGPRLEQTVEANKAAAVKRGRRIVVRLARSGLRDELLCSARVRRGATSEGLGINAPPQRFYLNERLTKTYRQLFYYTRQITAKLGWRFVWTKRGKIFVKEADGKRTHTIRTESDLERVFGQEAVIPIKE